MPLPLTFAVRLTAMNTSTRAPICANSAFRSAKWSLIATLKLSGSWSGSTMGTQHVSARFWRGQVEMIVTEPTNEELDQMVIPASYAILHTT